MPESMRLGIALLAGGALGAVHFGGLWWTVRHAATFRRPALSLLASVLLRMSLVLGGFHLVAGGSWKRLLLCLLGFVVARALATRLAQRPPPSARVRAAELLHAP